MTKTEASLFVVALMCGRGEPACAGVPAAGPSFRYYLVGGFPPLSADAGTPFHEDLICSLETEENPNAALGAAAYSVSLAAENLSIVDIAVAHTVSADVHDDPPGLRDGGFARAELTTGGVDGCEGRPGAVLTVVLSATLPIALPPEGSQTIARLAVESVYPAKGETLHGRVSFTDGCQGTGEPVLNRVQYAGGSFEPAPQDYIVDLRSWPDCPLAGGELQVIFQTMSTGQTPELFAGIAPTPEPAGPAMMTLLPPRANVYAAIVSQLPAESPGVQGWGFSLGLSGDVTLLAATTEGTVAASIAADPPGLRKSGFEYTEFVNPSAGFGGPQGQGVVSGVVLSLVERVTLAPSGTATVLALTIEGRDGQNGQLAFKDGLKGSGGPIANSATIDGGSRHFDCFQRAELRFETPVNPFHRGDLNDDGRIDITDPIRLLDFLFRGGEPPTCMDAADFNDDARLDLSDAVGSLMFKFAGGPRPSAPGPPQDPCGIDPEPHLPAGCAEYTRC